MQAYKWPRRNRSRIVHHGGVKQDVDKDTLAGIQTIMLIDSGFKANDIIAMRIQGGDEVIAKFLSQDDKTIKGVQTISTCNDTTRHWHATVSCDGRHDQRILCSTKHLL